MCCASKLLLLLMATASAAASVRYTPDWSSLDSRPLPSWYDRAKVGLFMHFGPYAVPGLESEWFWFMARRNSSEGDRRCANYLRQFFPPRFTYQGRSCTLSTNSRQDFEMSQE